MAQLFNIQAGIGPQNPGNWVRLRTLIVIRWVAIIGQVSAITVAMRLFNLQIDIGLCSAVIGASVIANLIAMFVYPENKRLSEKELTWTLVFDLTQLAALLFLTGGLNNPFALLILAPVIISATALGPRNTILVGGVAIVLATIVGWQHMPLRTDMGFVMRMPRDFMIGFWVAIVIGVVFQGIYAQRVATEISSMSAALLATQMALGREQKLTDLAGVVAATAHELGTPLATIKLAASELEGDLKDLPDLKDDARLIGEQADRCRDILRSMGRAGKDDKQIAHAPLSAVIREAAEPHLERGKSVMLPDLNNGSEPSVLRLPEIIHGVRNLVQNAVDFADTTVWVDLDWTADNISLRIVDDGRGYSQQVIGRIGDPFVRKRSTRSDVARRPGYEGMGLGLFIAKTLLERTGAELTFANARDAYSGDGTPGERKGAIVEVVWPRERLEPDPNATRAALGQNELLT
jgi:two-component system sensor histidine kinase RegB